MKQAQAIPRAPRATAHRVQFYAKEAAMLDQVGRFLAAGIELKEAAVVIATPAHIDGLRSRLPARAAVTYLDAHQTLQGILQGNELDEARFRQLVGDAVRTACRQGNGRVRAFGEMVALLMAQGRGALAMDLEGAWNRLITDVPLTLLCAYPLAAFPASAGGELAEVCRVHDHVLHSTQPAGEATPGETAAPAGPAAPSTLAAPELLEFLENAPVGMHQVDGEGILLWANRRELDLLGYTAAEYLGRNVREFHEDPRVVDELFDCIRAGQVVNERRATMRCKDGKPLPVSISSSAVMQEGRVVRSRCVMRPILDLVAAEAARAESEQRLRQRELQQAAVARIGHLALKTASLDALFSDVCRHVTQVLSGETCGILQCIPGSTDLQFRSGFGFPPGFAPRVPGDTGSHSGFILQERRPVIYGDLAVETRFTAAPRLLEQGVRSGVSVVIPTAAGAWGTIGVHARSANRFTNDDALFLEAVAHVLGAAIDRRQAEQDLRNHRDHLEGLVRERTRRLEQANRELDAFTSAVSHDLRGPVRAIAGFSALLAQRHSGRLDPHGRELLEEVRRATARMGDLIEDLLDLSRADRAPPVVEEVDLSALAREILAQEQEREPQRKVASSVADGIAVHGDPALLRMALENLLANAWKFTALRDDATITVSKHREGDELVLCVADNGAGFDMADAGRLFQPFQRLHRRSDFDGTGIGLATVRRIIERHGGRIWAQARPGAGASFYFTLPGPGPAHE